MRDEKRARARDFFARLWRESETQLHARGDAPRATIHRAARRFRAASSAARIVPMLTRAMCSGPGE